MTTKRRSQIVVLSVEYDPVLRGRNGEVIGEVGAAATWDWTDLTGERIEVIASGPVLEAVAW